MDVAEIIRQRARKALAGILLAEHGGDTHEAAYDFAILCDALGLEVTRERKHLPGYCHQCGRPLPIHTTIPSVGNRFRTNIGGVCSRRCKNAYYRGEVGTS